MATVVAMATPSAEPICKAVLLRPEASPASCSALGVAIARTVAISRSTGYLAASKGASPLAALTEGYQSAFAACAVLAAIGLALALLLPGRPPKTQHQLPEPASAALRNTN